MFTLRLFLLHNCSFNPRCWVELRGSQPACFAPLRSGNMSERGRCFLAFSRGCTWRAWHLAFSANGAAARHAFRAGWFQARPVRWGGAEWSGSEMHLGVMIEVIGKHQPQGLTVAWLVSLAHTNVVLVKFVVHVRLNCFTCCLDAQEWCCWIFFFFCGTLGCKTFRNRPRASWMLCYLDWHSITCMWTGV